MLLKFCPDKITDPLVKRAYEKWSVESGFTSSTIFYVDPLRWHDNSMICIISFVTKKGEDCYVAKEAFSPLTLRSLKDWM